MRLELRKRTKRGVTIHRGSRQEIINQFAVCKRNRQECEILDLDYPDEPIGEVFYDPSRCDDKRIKWIWWYDLDYFVNCDIPECLE
jgi:hypothetical protein